MVVCVLQDLGDGLLRRLRGDVAVPEITDGSFERSQLLGRQQHLGVTLKPAGVAPRGGAPRGAGVPRGGGGVGGRRGRALAGGVGGLLVQSRDNGAVAPADCKVVTERAPTERQLRDMLFAWTIVRHVKSNAVVFARDGVTAGIGAGQVNRRDSARIAAIRAREAADTAGWAHPRTIGSAMASEAFLPFPDALDAAVEAGATAVIQPGGALRDDEVIARADEAGIAMVFTGMRHFRH